MESLGHEYQTHLDRLAESLCPVTNYQPELDFASGGREVADSLLEDEAFADTARLIAQRAIDATHGMHEVSDSFGWDSEGRYLE